MEVLILIIITIAGFTPAILDIHSSALCLRVPNAVETNKTFKDANGKVNLGKLILYKMIFHVAAYIVCFCLYIFTDVGYGAFLFFYCYAIVTIFNGVLKNYKIYRKWKETGIG